MLHPLFLFSRRQEWTYHFLFWNLPPVASIKSQQNLKSAPQQNPYFKMASLEPVFAHCWNVKSESRFRTGFRHFGHYRQIPKSSKAHQNRFLHGPDLFWILLQILLDFCILLAGRICSRRFQKSALRFVWNLYFAVALRDFGDLLKGVSTGVRDSWLIHLAGIRCKSFLQMQLDAMQPMLVPL